MSGRNTLAELSKKSSKAKITDFAGDSLLCDRLKELGIHLGMEVSYVGEAPLKGPKLYRFGNTVLALRHEEASCAIIQK